MEEIYIIYLILENFKINKYDKIFEYINVYEININIL